MGIKNSCSLGILWPDLLRRAKKFILCFAQQDKPWLKFN